ncbi:hypothetical protein DL89DRAFT_269776 [Linderina pennispora]|uniref:F-box domain-containing protein n=1 Tax=Linderina pennispora TaxID=61395 RepID=A0A1Y1VZQ6_9FUNG|nr:uncharacterized protein DL89DRAFT_269776 [Linderina pennispora]ORX66739.1 hypothetical protein DL89DRAFT_269776 [Linderina pennispora]
MTKNTLTLDHLTGGTILDRILGYLVGDLRLYSDRPSPYSDFYMLYEDHQTAIRYALVSRQWMEYLVPYILRTIYIVTRLSDEPPAGKFNLVHRVFRLQKTVVGMGGARHVKQLYIYNGDDELLPTLNTLLDGNGFGETSWPSLKEVIFHGNHTFHTELGEKEHANMIHSYLSRLAPSLATIYGISNPVLNAVDNRLSNKRLYLNTETHRHLTSTHFPHLITLDLDDTYGMRSYHLLTFFAPTLRNLTLRICLESLFTWQQFLGSATDTTVFKELTSSENPSQNKPLGSLCHPHPRLPAFYGPQTLLFPKLDTIDAVHIFNAHVDFNDLFPNIAVRSLLITELLENLPSINSMPLKHVDRLSLGFSHLFSSGYHDTWGSTYIQLFETYSKVRFADISIPLLPTTKLNWPNLLRLELVISQIDWSSFEIFLPDLLHLKILTVIKDSDDKSEYYAERLSNGIESYTPTSLHAISQTLEKFTYQRVFGGFDPSASEFIRQLILRAPQLMVVKAERKYIQPHLKTGKSQDIEFIFP